MQINCPHCHHGLEVVDEAPLSDISCPSCGSQFNLLGEDENATLPRSTASRKVGRFVLLHEVGVGAYGSVWRGRDPQLDRQIAVKIPRKGQLNQEESEQFFREARAAAQLKHPNIVTVHEIGKDEDTIYIVSDFVEGVSLADQLSAGPLSMRESIQLCLKISRALHHAHENGVIHRDLKPGNIMLDKQGEPHVTDFGLAKRDAGEITMTIDGRILGTPAYMPPEQAAGHGHTVDRTADVYSTGVILFEMLTGAIPFRGNTRMLLHQVINDEPPNPRRLNLNIDQDLATITLKCLEKEPAKRYQTAEELAGDLNKYLQGEPISARPIPAIERAWRKCKRKPALTSALTLSTLLLATLAIAGPIVAVRQTSLTKQAEDQRRVANARLDLANDAVSEMLTKVGSETLKHVPQMESVRAALLDKALLLYEDIGKTSDGKDEQTRFTTAMASFQVARIRHLLGTGENPDVAEAAYKNAILQFSELSDQFRNKSEYQQQLARSHMWLTELLREFGGDDRIEEAERNFDAAIKIQTEIASETTNENRLQYQIDLGRSHMNRGIVRKNKGQFTKSKNDYDKAEQIFSKVILDDGLTPAQIEECRRLNSKCLINRVMRALALYKTNPNQNILEDAKNVARGAIDDLKTVIEENRRNGLPPRPKNSLNLGKAYNNLAIVLLTPQPPNETSLDEADQQITEAVRVFEQLNVGTREVRFELAKFHNTKAYILSKNNEVDPAISEWEKAGDILETVCQQNRGDTAATEELARVWCNICGQFQKRGGKEDHAKAINAIERLTDLTCKKSRYKIAAGLMRKGRDTVQDSVLAGKYDELLAFFQNKEQNAQ